MIVIKLTILLTMVCAVLIFAIKVWAESNPLEALVENYPTWIYISVLLMFLDVIGIFASAIWLLFFR